MGSKRRIAKEILPIILKDRKPAQYYVEPFCGGCNTIDKVDGPRLASDSNKYLIALLNHVQAGGEMPDYVSEQEYKRVKNSMGAGAEDWYIGFVGFSCSFGSKFFGGFARNIKKTAPNADVLNSTSRNYCAESNF